MKKKQKRHGKKVQTIRRQAWKLPTTSQRHSESREEIGAKPGERCWVWVAYPTKRSYREKAHQLYGIVRRSGIEGTKVEPFYSLFWNGSYVTSADTYAECAYMLARHVYSLPEKFLVPSELLASFDAIYNNKTLPPVADGETWLDAWDCLESRLTNFGQGKYTPLGQYLESDQDKVIPVGHSQTIVRPARRVINLGNGDSTLDASSAACGMDDEQAAEVVAYLNEPASSSERLSRREKRRRLKHLKAEQQGVPHYLRGVTDATTGRSWQGNGGTFGFDPYDAYDVPRYQKPAAHPTPLGKKVEGHRFIECPEDWEDCSDMQFRDIMEWRCSRPDNYKDRVADEECFFELSASAPEETP